MPNHPPPTHLRDGGNVQPEMIVKTKIPSLATRRAACTHLTMERLYGNYQCEICHRPSLLGWVYVCTQDDNPNSPVDSLGEAKYGTNNWHTMSDSTIHQPDFRMPTPELASGMEEAIKDERYSPEQAKILRLQKQNVVNVANAAIEQFQREAISRDPIRLRDSTRQSRMAQAGHEDANRNFLPSLPPKFRMFPYCKFRACPSCRPTFRDRSWQQIDEVYSNDASIIVQSQQYDLYSTRPIASHKIMQNIGKGASPGSACRLIPLNKNNINLLSMDGAQRPSIKRNLLSANPKVLEPQDFTVASLSGTNSVRENMRRVFKGLNRRDSSLSGKMILLKSKSNVNFENASRERQDEHILVEAASVPLPERDIVDGLVGEVGEIEKVDLAEGVAVKEESADLGAADIFMSV